jgi:urease accessory protein
MHTISRSTCGFGAAAAAVLALSAGAAWAHTGVGATGGFAAGVLHPILGPDHLLVMLAAGVWAGQHGGRARWALPAAFLTLVGVGLAVGMVTPAFALTEMLILASLVALGLLIALEKRFRVVWAAGLVALFAFFHGHVHGAEVPATASGLDYAAGVLAATALLLTCGLALHWALQRLSARWGARLAGLLALAGAGGIAFGA